MKNDSAFLVNNPGKIHFLVLLQDKTQMFYEKSCFSLIDFSRQGLGKDLLYFLFVYFITHLTILLVTRFSVMAVIVFFYLNFFDGNKLPVFGGSKFMKLRSFHERIKADSRKSARIRWAVLSHTCLALFLLSMW